MADSTADFFGGGFQKSGSGLRRKAGGKAELGGSFA